MDLTEGGCSRGSTQCAPGLCLNTVQPARNRVGVAPCTIPPTRNEPIKQPSIEGNQSKQARVCPMTE